jgi:hypothetical protein
MPILTQGNRIGVMNHRRGMGITNLPRINGPVAHRVGVEVEQVKECGIQSMSHAYLILW